MKTEVQSLEHSLYLWKDQVNKGYNYNTLYEKVYVCIIHLRIYILYVYNMQIIINYNVLIMDIAVYKPAHVSESLTDHAWHNAGDIGYLSKLVNATGVMFRLTPSDYHYSWHHAPRRQFIVNLDADVEVEVSSGEKRVIKQGEVFFVEDVTGEYTKLVT